jgi:hypothetical protein
LMLQAAGRPLTIHEIRTVLIGSVDPHAGPSGRSSTRLGYGYLNPAAAVTAARRLGAERPAPQPGTAVLPVRRTAPPDGTPHAPTPTSTQSPAASRPPAAIGARTRSRARVADRVPPPATTILAVPNAAADDDDDIPLEALHEALLESSPEEWEIDGTRDA